MRTTASTDGQTMASIDGKLFGKIGVECVRVFVCARVRVCARVCKRKRESGVCVRNCEKANLCEKDRM